MSLFLGQLCCRNLFFHFLGHCTDACLVAAIRLDEYANILFIAVAQPCNTTCSPRVNLAINHDGFGVVLGVEVCDETVVAVIELHIGELLWEKYSLEVTLNLFLVHILAERLNVVTIVTKVLDCLNEE